MNQFDETYRKALAGDANAMCNIAVAYLEGEGTEADPVQFFEWTNRAAEAGQAEAMCNLALAYRKGVGTEADPVQFFEWTKRAADAGHAEAMCNLAVAFLEGEGTEADPVQFFEWTKNAAEAGQADAMHDLAVAYLEGKGTEADPVQFFEWTKKAAEAGQVQAMCNIAVAYLVGEGTEADPVQFFEWTNRAAEAGQAEAMCNLALAYRKGVGTEADPVQFFEWTKNAAEAGQADAMYNLAVAYLEGKGTEADPVQFFEWTTRAAEAGHAQAMHNLALAYRKGEGIPNDVDIYFTWINKAAERGHVHASMLNHAYCVLRDGEVNPTDILSSIDQLLNAVNRIKQRHILDDGSIGKNPEIEIAHFTHFQTLEKMLPFKQGNPLLAQNHHFRLYNAEYLNDPHEGCRIFQHMKSHPKYDGLYKMLFNNLDTESAVTFLHEDLAVYICSCTLRSDRLDLWRAYGNDGDGVCIISPLSAFEDNKQGASYALGEYLKEMRKPEESMQEEMGAGKAEAAVGGTSRQRAQTVPRLLYRVKYLKEEIDAAIQDLQKPLQEIARFMETILDESQKIAIRKCVIVLMSDILYLYKNEEYRNEEEVRLVFAATIDHPMLELDEQNPGRLFMRTDAFLFRQPGSQIIIGPRVKEKRAVELNLKFRLNRHGFKDTRVMQSKVAYR